MKIGSNFEVILCGIQNLNYLISTFEILFVVKLLSLQFHLMNQLFLDEFSFYFFTKKQLNLIVRFIWIFIFFKKKKEIKIKLPCRHDTNRVNDFS